MNIQPLLNGILQNPVPCLIPIFAVLGILALVSGFTLRSQGKVVNWAKTNGTLIDCNATSKTVKSRASNMTINESHVVTISYAYVVKEQQLAGKNFAVDVSMLAFPTHKDAESVARKFKASPNLVVYYDPAKPSDCTLKLSQRQNSTSAAVNFGAGVLLLILAVGMFFVYRPY